MRDIDPPHFFFVHHLLGGNRSLLPVSTILKSTADFLSPHKSTLALFYPPTTPNFLCCPTNCPQCDSRALMMSIPLLLPPSVLRVSTLPIYLIKRHTHPLNASTSRPAHSNFLANARFVKFFRIKSRFRFWSRRCVTIRNSISHS